MSRSLDQMPEIDRAVPTGCRTACFALGCFWDPDGLYGGMRGVISTRVGFAGGTHPHPTYHELRDHRETVEVRYDPGETSFAELAEVFWHAHNPAWAGVLLRFAAALFVQTDGEDTIARDLAAKRGSQDGTTIRTPILRLRRFHPADPSHQKHFLRQHQPLMSEFRELYPDPWAFTCSTAAARVNAVLSAHADAVLIRSELSAYGLSAEGRQLVSDHLRASG